MNAVEFQLLRLEDIAHRETRIWDGLARKRMRAGEICSSCKMPLPQPYAAECTRCASCAGRHHVRMTFSHFNGWHCRFFTERWQLLPKRLIFRDATSILETARRGNGLIDDAARESLERALKLGRGGIMLRLSNEQFLAIGGSLPSPNSPR